MTVHEQCEASHHVSPKRLTPNQCRPPVSAASHPVLRTFSMTAQQRSPETNDRSSFRRSCHRSSCGTSHHPPIRNCGMQHTVFKVRSRNGCCLGSMLTAELQCLPPAHVALF